MPVPAEPLDTSKESRVQRFRGPEETLILGAAETSLFIGRNQLRTVVQKQSAQWWSGPGFDLAIESIPERWQDSR